MQFKVGYELIYNFPQPTPIILVVNVHDSRRSDIVVADDPVSEPLLAMAAYRDAFGNQCHRVLAPPGRLRLRPVASSMTPAGRTSPLSAAIRIRWRRTSRGTLDLHLDSYTLRPTCCRKRRGDCSAARRQGMRASGLLYDFVHNHMGFNYQNARATRERDRGVRRTDWRLPRLRSPRDRLLPLHEYSRAICTGCFERCRHAAPWRRRRFRGVPFEAWMRSPLAPVRARATTCRGSGGLS